MLIKFDSGNRAQYDGEKWLTNGHYLINWERVKAFGFRYSKEGKANKEIAALLENGTRFGGSVGQIDTKDPVIANMDAFAQSVFNTARESVSLTGVYCHGTLVEVGDCNIAVFSDYYLSIADALSEKTEVVWKSAGGQLDPLVVVEKKSNEVLFVVTPMRPNNDLASVLKRLLKRLEK